MLRFVEKRKLKKHHEELTKQLTEAIEKKRYDAIREMVASNIHDHEFLNTFKYQGKSLLSYMIDTNQVDIVKLLLTCKELNIHHDGHLLTAVKIKYVEMVKALLSREDLDTEYKDGSGDTALTEASRLGLTEIVKALLGCKRVNRKACNDAKQTALLWAVDHANEDVVKLLLNDAEIDKNAVNGGGCTAFLMSLKNRYYDIALLLASDLGVVVSGRAEENTVIAFLPDFVAKTRTELFYKIVSRQNLQPLPENMLLFESAASNLLIKEILNASVDKVALLLSLPITHINNADNDGRNALIEAVRSGNTTIVDMLLAREDIDINVVTANGCNAFFTALKHSEVIIARTLLTRQDFDFNLKVKDKHGDAIPILHYLAANGYGEFVSTLINLHHVDIDGRDANGNTPLIHAAINSRLEVVELLLSGTLTANINLPNNNGSNALLEAVQAGAIDIVALLLAKGADIHHADNSGKTALQWAIIKKNSPMISLLLTSKHITINDVDAMGRTIIHYAAETGDADLLAKLLEVDDSMVNVQDNNGDTALNIAAAKGGGAGIVKTLLRHGADPLIENHTTQYNAVETAMEAHHDGLLLCLQNPEKYRRQTVYQRDPAVEAPPVPSAPPMEDVSVQTFGLFAQDEVKTSIAETNTMPASAHAPVMKK